MSPTPLASVVSTIIATLHKAPCPQGSAPPAGRTSSAYDPLSTPPSGCKAAMASALPEGEESEVPPPSGSAAPRAYARGGCGEVAVAPGAEMYCSSRRTPVCAVASELA